MEASTGFLPFLISSFQKGGSFMYPIAITLGFSIAFILERLIRLFKTYSVGSAESFMVEVQKHILANDIDGAIRVCNGAGQASLPRVIKAGLTRASRDETQIQNAIDAASLEVIPRLEKRLGYLALIANIATLLGLLGTIVGLIHSFGAVALADAAQRQAILANGIAEALNCTAFGLIVAITTMVMHSVLTSKASTLTSEVDEFGVKLLDLLSARKYQHSSEKAF
ncbi:MAG: MotA/TolQ/ExbB proton channel family protein [Deltaproteobacteria bacterium]|nr:MotA/TolQ/ExbB proton channel family protein [Deltaproteobacteria bacterium]